MFLYFFFLTISTKILTIYHKKCSNYIFHLKVVWIKSFGPAMTVGRRQYGLFTMYPQKETLLLTSSILLDKFISSQYFISMYKQT